MEFKNVTPADREWVQELVYNSDRYLCEYSFGNIYCWGSVYGMQIAKVEGSLVLKMGANSYTWPVGLEPEKAADKLIKQIPNIKFKCLQKSDIEILNELYPQKFTISSDNNYADYIYQSGSLITLSGKKLASKRNHINYFENNYSWHTEPITNENLASIRSFNDEWCKKNGCGLNKELKNEQCAIERGFNSYDQLGFNGLVLIADGKVAAFSWGEPINSEYYCVHIEKAMFDQRGAYQMINREFVKAYGAPFKYINREDANGDEGLKRAKESYHPLFLADKYTAAKVD